jgi:hypothetical protein
VSFVGSFLCRRTMRVRLDGTTTRPVPLMTGVPQGAVLSPLLWAVFLDPPPPRRREAVDRACKRDIRGLCSHEATLARGSIAAMLGVATAWLGEREVAVRATEHSVFSECSVARTAPRRSTAGACQFLAGTEGNCMSAGRWSAQH